jgi:hypothetical protein
VIATLKEKTSNLLNPYYVWKLVNRDSFEEYVIAPDDNSNSYYYDSFTMSVGTPFVSTGADVIIDAVPGQYDYFVYEVSIEYDVDLTSIVGEVENGILIIEGNQSKISDTAIVFTASNSDTTKVFNEL